MNTDTRRFEKPYPCSSASICGLICLALLFLALTPAAAILLFAIIFPLCSLFSIAVTESDFVNSDRPPVLQACQAVPSGRAPPVLQ